jgi:hypothetical protein
MPRIRHESKAQHDNWHLIAHESDDDIKTEELVFLLRCVHRYVLQISSPSHRLFLFATFHDIWRPLRHSNEWIPVNHEVDRGPYAVYSMRH